MSVADDKFEELDFEDLQAAVESSPKGRWFLEEYARRNRAHETGSILEAIAKLERVITANGPIPPATLPDPALRQNQLKYFKRDEDLFVEARTEPTVSVVPAEPAPPEQPVSEPEVFQPEAKAAAPAEPRGARLKITRSSTPAIIESGGTHVVQATPVQPAIPDLDIPAMPNTVAEPAIAEEAPVAPPAPTAPLFGERKQRIVITRKVVETEAAIPLVDDQPQPAAD